MGWTALLSFLVVLTASWDSGWKSGVNVSSLLGAVDVAVNGLAGEFIHFLPSRRKPVVLIVGATVEGILQALLQV